jgi:streptogramin lyase
MNGMRRATAARMLGTMLAFALAACSASVGGATSPPSSTQAPPTPRATVAPTPLPEGVLASIELQPGSAPSAIVAAYGSIWVASHRGTQLYRIDPGSDTVVAQIDLGQESCGMPGIGAGRVWISPCEDGTKTIIVDPTTNQVAGSLNAGNLNMAFAKGSLWIGTLAHDGTLLRVDPSKLNTISTVAAGHGADLAFAGGGFVWVADTDQVMDAPDVISKIDPTTGQVVATLSAPNPGGDAMLLYAFDSLWRKASDNDRLIKIDPGSGHATTFTIPGYQALTQYYDIVPADGLGSLWLRIADGSVVRVDPATGKVTASYPADSTAGGGYVAVAFGSLWVANFGTDTVWRVRIQE